MILVLFGTFDIEFKRPLLEIQKLCQEGIISEEVIVQSGYTAIENIQYVKMKPFIQPDELNELHQKARIIITHAGTGSLIKALKFNKKVIGIARLLKYGEHVDNHQVEILEKFAELNYILPWRDGIPLKLILTEISDFVPTKFVSNKPAIINYLKNYIDAL
jgi:UDP-N-acetylglucosamine transferase subunit ALG13